MRALHWPHLPDLMVYILFVCIGMCMCAVCMCSNNWLLYTNTLVFLCQNEACLVIRYHRDVHLIQKYTYTTVSCKSEM